MRKKIPYIIIFIVYLSILVMAPLALDDWENVTHLSKGLKEVFCVCKWFYLNHEGRVVPRFLLIFFTYNHFLWAIVNSFGATLVIYLINKMTGQKKVTLLLTILAFFGTAKGLFAEVYTWVTGNVTYFFPTILIILFTALYYKKFKYKEIIMPILSIGSALFMEHFAIAFLFENIILMIRSYIKSKKIERYQIVSFVFAIIGNIVLFAAPGTQMRINSETNSEGINSIFYFIDYNIKNAYFYIIYKSQPFLNLILSISMFFLIRKNIKRKTVRVFLYIYTTTFLLSGIKTWFSFIKFDTYYHVFFGYSPWYIAAYLLTFYVIYFVLLIKNSKSVLDDIKILFYMVGMVSILVMLPSPTIGDRIAYLYYILLSATSIGVIGENVNDNIISERILTIPIIVVFSSYFFFYYSWMNITNDNVERIERAKENNQKVVVLENIKINHAIYNISNPSEYHLKWYKDYYKIPEDMKIFYTN